MPGTGNSKDTGFSPGFNLPSGSAAFGPVWLGVSHDALCWGPAKSGCFVQCCTTLQLLIHCSRNDRLFYRRKRKEKKNYESRRYLKQWMCSTYCPLTTEWAGIKGDFLTERELRAAVLSIFISGGEPGERRKEKMDVKKKGEWEKMRATW